MRTVMGVLAAATLFACGADPEARDGGGDSVDGARPDAAASTTRSAEPSPSVTADTDGGGELLCARTEADEAFTPPGGDALSAPGAEQANSPRRCVRTFGLEGSIEEVRAFFRTALRDRGYELVRDDVQEGIVRENVSRTFLRARKPGRVVTVTLDEWSADRPANIPYAIQGKVQIDALGE